MADGNVQKAAAEAMRRRAKGRGSGGQLGYYIGIGSVVAVTIFAVFAALTDSGSKKSMAPSVLDNKVNDASFIKDVNGRTDGNFTAAASPFWNDWTYGDVKFGFSGAKVSDMIGMPGAAKMCERDEDVETGGVPQHFDARIKYPKCLQEIRDSGNCTASYAIAAASSLSSRFCIADFDKYGSAKLSPQQVLSCNKKSRGCNGGGIDAVWAYMERRGLYPEECLAYAGSAGAQCKTECDESKKLKPISHCILSKQKWIKQEIFNRGPVVMPVYVTDELMVYKDGVFTPTDRSQSMYDADNKAILHAVTVIGWGKQEGTPYWIVENSWGTSWGEEGYGRIAMDTILREGYTVVGYPETEEAIAEAAAKEEARKVRLEQAKKDRAEREERIREQARLREEQRKLEEGDDDDSEEDLELDDADFEVDDEEVEVDDKADDDGEM